MSQPMDFKAYIDVDLIICSKLELLNKRLLTKILN